jgi:hypothetical protein
LAAVELEIGLLKAFPGVSPREIREEGADLVRKLHIWELAYGKQDGIDGVEGGGDIAELG